MESIIKALSDSGIGLGSLLLIGYLFVTQSIRQDKKDNAYIATLNAMQNNMARLQGDIDKNWALTQEIAKATQSTIQILSQLNCVTNLKK